MNAIAAEPEEELEDELEWNETEAEEFSLHPSSLLGADPFEFCSFGRKPDALQALSGHTFIDRVIRFVDEYQPPVV